MASPDYLASITADFETAEIDTPTYLVAGALVGIGQQLRRIADVMERDQQDRLNREGYAR